MTTITASLECSCSECGGPLSSNPKSVAWRTQRGKTTCRVCSVKATAPVYEGIVEAFRSGVPTRELAVRYGITQGAVSRHLTSRGETVGVHHTLNNSCFESIDTIDAAYWFGFLCADGYITADDNSWTIGCNLQTGDSEHLSKLLAFLGSSSEVKLRSGYHAGRGKTYHWSSVRVSGGKLGDDLLGHGLRVIKGGDPAPIDNIPDRLFPAFTRGYLDGDGRIAQQGRRKTWSLHICAPNKEVPEYLFRRCPVAPRHNSYKEPTTWKVLFGGTQLVAKICDWLYADGGPSLNRKREKAEQCMSEAVSKRRG